jgi:hypothetical protein
MGSMTGFAEQSDLALGSATLDCIVASALAIADDAALPTRETHAAAPARSMQHCYSYHHVAPNLTKLRLFCGIFSAFAWRPPVPRRGLRHAMAAEKSGSVSSHLSLPRVRRMPAATLQDSPHRG